MLLTQTSVLPYAVAVMQRTLSEHLAHLEAKIFALRRQLRFPNLHPFQIAEQQLELENAEEALRLFRRAYELEQKIPK